MNALAHGAESLYTPLREPGRDAWPRCAARELIAESLDQDPGERDRAALALGSILCAYALDSALFSLHHVVCQTLVRVCGMPARRDERGDAAAHDGGDARARARRDRRRSPPRSAPSRTRSAQRIEELAAAAGASPTLGADRGAVDEASTAMLERPGARSWMPDPPDRDRSSTRARSKPRAELSTRARATPDSGSNGARQRV